MFHNWRANVKQWNDNKPRARQHRRKPTPAETCLWQQLRNRKLGGFRFRRQHAVGPYIVDFICSEVGLVIEVDGPIHADQREADLLRERDLEAFGLTVLRVTNDAVLQEMESVLIRIHSALKSANVQAEP